MKLSMNKTFVNNMFLLNPIQDGGGGGGGEWCQKDTTYQFFHCNFYQLQT